MTADHVYSDEYIEHWAEVFLSLRAHGAALPWFVSFLRCPRAYIAPAHARFLQSVEAQAERGTEDLPRRNGQIVEPLHHHAHPRSASRDFHVERDLSEREP